MYSLFEINPVRFVVVSCTIDVLRSSGMTATRYPVMLVAPPARDGAFQVILIEDSVISSMAVDFGLPKAALK